MCVYIGANDLREPTYVSFNESSTRILTIFRKQYTCKRGRERSTIIRERRRSYYVARPCTRCVIISPVSSSCTALFFNNRLLLKTFCHKSRARRFRARNYNCRTRSRRYVPVGRFAADWWQREWERESEPS